MKSGKIYAKSGPRSIPINTLSLKSLIKLRGFTQQGFADKLGVGIRCVQGWCYGEHDPSEDNFDSICEALNVPPVLLTAHPKEIRDRARHERVMDFYNAQLLGELPGADYREVQLIEADIERTAEFDPEADNTREAPVTVPSQAESP